MEKGIDDPCRCPAFAEPSMKKQCEATTLPSTYSGAHRCLKRRGVKKAGKKSLCAHHQTMAARRRA